MGSPRGEEQEKVRCMFQLAKTLEAWHLRICLKCMGKAKYEKKVIGEAYMSATLPGADTALKNSLRDQLVVGGW